MYPERKTSNWKLLLYMSPVYIAIIVGIPMVKHAMTKKTADTEISNAPKAVNAPLGEIKKAGAPQYGTEQPNTGTPLNYEPEKTAAARPAPAAEPVKQPAAQPEARKSGAGGERQTPKPRNPKEARKDMSIGYTKDYITYMAGKNLSVKGVSALLNNSFVVKGFMARGTVKAALGSPQGLQNYLSNSEAVNSFLNKSVIKAGMGNQQLMNAVFSSELANAVLDTPAMQNLLKHPDALNNLMVSNPQIAMTLATNPNIMNALMNNPRTAGAAGKMNMGGMP
ncbi:MAG: hypothetical protein NTX59_01925 [Elusimicrobia bacterium]|nr:hypothetical protein [Elusimicrobiota bacterium]